MPSPPGSPQISHPSGKVKKWQLCSTSVAPTLCNWQSERWVALKWGQGTVTAAMASLMNELSAAAGIGKNTPACMCCPLFHQLDSPPIVLLKANVRRVAYESMPDDFSDGQLLPEKFL